jgi:tetratricopeptide (TPR) repeat protein
MKNKPLGILLVWVVGLPTTALAQTPPYAVCESNPACVLLYEQAQQQSKAGQLLAALNSYKLAYGVNQDPRLLFSVARVLDKTGQAAEAITYYQRFIDSAVDDANQKDKAREYLTLLQAKQPAPVAADPTTAQSPLPLVPVASVASSGPARDTEHTVPVYKKGWFWGVLIGSAAAVGLGVGLGVGLQNRTPTLPADVNTFEPSF